MAKKNYINNKDLHEDLLLYKQKCKLLELNNKPKPQLSNYFGQSILLIAERLGRKPCFNQYSYLDEMKNDGVTAAIKYASSYDPEKFQNPFAYFTTIIYNAFINRLNSEQAQQYTKAILYRNSGSLGAEEDEGFTNDSLNSTITAFENRMRNKKAKEQERIQRKKDELTLAEELIDIDEMIEVLD